MRGRPGIEVVFVDVACALVIGNIFPRQAVGFLLGAHLGAGGLRIYLLCHALLRTEDRQCAILVQPQLLVVADERALLVRAHGGNVQAKADGCGVHVQQGQQRRSQIDLAGYLVDYLWLNVVRRIDEQRDVVFIERQVRGTGTAGTVIRDNHKQRVFGPGLLLHRVQQFTQGPVCVPDGPVAPSPGWDIDAPCRVCIGPASGSETPNSTRRVTAEYASTTRSMYPMARNRLVPGGCELAAGRVAVFICVCSGMQAGTD